MADLPPVRVETLIEASAAHQRDHPALIYGERCWTYGRLRAEMDRRAALLIAAGLVPGDVVVTAETMSDDVVLAFLACCRAGIVFLYLAPNLTAAEFAPLVARSRARWILRADPSPHSAVPNLAPLPLALPGTPPASLPVTLQDPAAVVCIRPTSGTTGGVMKLIVAAHSMLTWLATTQEWEEPPDSVYYFPQTIYFPFVDFCTVFRVGGTIVLSNAMEPGRIEREMAAHGVTAIWTVPALIRLLVAQSRPTPDGLALRVVRTGAAPLAPEIERAVTVRYGAQLAQKYALTEGGSMLGTPRTGAPLGSIGKPFPGVVARIVNDRGNDLPAGATGELIIRSPSVMLGYLDDPAATAEAVRDGWLWTGDLARQDAAGFYFLEGRTALRINVGGLKVAPEEVEHVLMQHPAVREAVVLATADTTRGEAVRAVIVPDGDAPTVGALRRHCRERLAAYKVPRQWEFRNDLPRSPLGKVLRDRL